MPIEGPLRELGIHDVFQLLDLSRKTGTLVVRSSLRDNEGTIFFANGRVVYASIKSNPHPIGEVLLHAGKVTEADLERAITMQRDRHGNMRLGDILVEIGAISSRELQRQMRLQVEEVVFELMSWTEGFFTFEEGRSDELPPDAGVSITTESLLMEGARRIDEWSRIATRIPELGIIPRLSDIPGERAPQLDLLPDEWEVLSMVDADRSVREIARGLGRSDFEVARVLYGLVCTGVVDVSRGTTKHSGASQNGTRPGSNTPDSIIMHHDDEKELVERARARCRAGKTEEAIDELKTLLRNNPDRAALNLELGYALAKQGMLAEAIASWTKFLQSSPKEKKVVKAVKQLIEAANKMHAGVEGHYNV